MTTARAHRRSAELIPAFREHLLRRDWKHFLTLTSRTPASFEKLRRSFEIEFIRRVSRIAQQKVPWFVAAEAGASGLNLHLHALLAGTAHISFRQIERAWKLGRAYVAVYDPARGAANYVLKEIAVHPDWYDVSRSLPSLLTDRASSSAPTQVEPSAASVS